MAQRFVRLAAGAILQVAALVLAHQLVYLARYGSRFGEALQHAGHGEAWSAAVVSSIVLGVGLVAAGVARLAYLGLLLRRRGEGGATARGDLPSGSLISIWVRTAPRIGAVTVLLLTVQENLEHAAIGLPMPGPGILLTQEYPAGLWIALAVALAISLVGALFAWRHRTLQVRLRAARPRVPRSTAALPARTGLRIGRPADSVLGRRSALRAPPPVAVAA